MKIIEIQVSKSTRILSIVAIGLSGFMLNSASYADGILAEPTQAQWYQVMGLGGGASFTTNLGPSKNFPIINPITDQFFTYNRNSPTQNAPLFEAFLGAERAVYSNWRVQAGLAYDQTGAISSNGILTQGADVQSSDRYSYQFKVITRQLLVQGKLMRQYHENYFPYLMLGLGASFNSASGFTTNVPPFLTFTRQYANKSNNTFAYRAGLGLDVDLSSHARLGIGYRFAGLGGFTLGKATIDNISVPGTLSESNLNANEVLAQFTYIF